MLRVTTVIGHGIVLVLSAWAVAKMYKVHLIVTVTHADDLTDAAVDLSIVFMKTKHYNMRIEAFYSALPTPSGVHGCGDSP